MMPTKLKNRLIQGIDKVSVGSKFVLVRTVTTNTDLFDNKSVVTTYSVKSGGMPSSRTHCDGDVTRRYKTERTYRWAVKKIATSIVEREKQ